LTHLRLAQQHGLDADALTALMTLLAPDLALPRASLAMEAVHLLTDEAPVALDDPSEQTTKETS